MSLRIVGLAAHHDRQGFNCGEPALDDFLHKLARQQSARDFNQTYVAIGDDETRIRGYYSLSAGAIEFQSWPAGLKLPRYPIPVARIGRLAVDLRDQQAGVGSFLLNHALRLSVSLADRIGLHAVVVDPKHTHAAAFYARYGFQPLQTGRMSMFLLMPVIRRSLLADH